MSLWICSYPFEWDNNALDVFSSSLHRYARLSFLRPDIKNSSSLFVAVNTCSSAYILQVFSKQHCNKASLNDRITSLVPSLTRARPFGALPLWTPLWWAQHLQTEWRNFSLSQPNAQIPRFVSILPSCKSMKSSESSLFPFSAWIPYSKVSTKTDSIMLVACWCQRSGMVTGSSPPERQWKKRDQEYLTHFLRTSQSRSIHMTRALQTLARKHERELEESRLPFCFMASSRVPFCSWEPCVPKKGRKLRKKTTCLLHTVTEFMEAEPVSRGYWTGRIQLTTMHRIYCKLNCLLYKAICKYCHAHRVFHCWFFKY